MTSPTPTRYVLAGALVVEVATLGPPARREGRRARARVVRSYGASAVPGSRAPRSPRRRASPSPAPTRGARSWWRCCPAGARGLRCVVDARGGAGTHRRSRTLPPVRRRGRGQDPRRGCAHRRRCRRGRLRAGGAEQRSNVVQQRRAAFGVRRPFARAHGRLKKGVYQTQTNMLAMLLLSAALRVSLTGHASTCTPRASSPTSACTSAAARRPPPWCSAPPPPRAFDPSATRAMLRHPLIGGRRARRGARRRRRRRTRAHRAAPSAVVVVVGADPSVARRLRRRNNNRSAVHFFRASRWPGALWPLGARQRRRTLAAPRARRALDAPLFEFTAREHARQSASPRGAALAHTSLSAATVTLTADAAARVRR